MDRVEYRQATMVHKSLNRSAQDYMKEMFRFVTDVSQRQARYVDILSCICLQVTI